MIDCPLPPQYPHAVPTTSGMSYGDVVIYYCNSGYGSRTIPQRLTWEEMCSVNGTWEAKEPPIYCARELLSSTAAANLLELLMML